MGVQGLEDQTIVSMLAVLGIGLYRADGSVIRAGTEKSDADFYMFEDEAYGLIEKLKQQYNGETWIPFSDFYSALTDFGL